MACVFADFLLHFAESSMLIWGRKKMYAFLLVWKEPVGLLSLNAVHFFYFIGGHISSHFDIESDTLKSSTITILILTMITSYI